MAARDRREFLFDRGEQEILIPAARAAPGRFPIGIAKLWSILG